MASIKLPDKDFLDKAFVYNKKTGSLTFRETRSNNAKKGQIAGSIDSKGYRFVRLNKIAYRIHRIIWKMNYGSDPINTIDHINGDKLDNRLINLRDVTHQNNIKNCKKRTDNTSGVTGVSFNKKLNKWTAYFTIKGKLITIGYFVDKKEAIKARLKIAAENGFHTNHGR